MGVCNSSNKKEDRIKSLNKGYLFYYKNEINPWVKEENVEWKPYEQKIQIDLKKGFENYLKDAKTNYKTEIPSKIGFIFDFKNWDQINKETKDILPFKREFCRIETNILRKKGISKYIDSNDTQVDYENIFLNDKIFDIKDVIFNEGKEFESVKNTYNFQIEKNIKKVYFNVINEYNIELKVSDNLCFLKDNYKLDLNFKDFILILKDEMENLSKLFDKSNSAKVYMEKIHQLSNSSLFFNRIVEIFMIEGFLQNKINQFLRMNKSNYFENFKLFYISLLASLRYCSLNLPIPNYTLGYDILLFGYSQSNAKEMELYKSKNNTNFSIILNEFFICSKKPKYSKNLNLQDENKIEIIWEILVPYYLLEYENESLVFIETVLPHPNDEEVIIVSGSVFFIDKIIPYYEDNQEKKNKFVIKCILRSLTFSSYYEALKIYYIYRNVKIKKI